MDIVEDKADPLGREIEYNDDIEMFFLRFWSDYAKMTSNLLENRRSRVDKVWAGYKSWSFVVVGVYNKADPRLGTN